MYEQIVRRMSVGLTVWQLDDDTDPASFRLIDANVAAERASELPLRDRLGQSIGQVSPALLDSDVPRHLWEIVRDGEKRDLGEFVLITPSGEQRFGGTGFPIGDRCAGAVFANITERQAAEESLRDLRTLLLSILNAAGQGIFGLDRDGRVTFANPTATTLLGWDDDGLVGSSLDAIFDGAVEGPVHQTLRDGAAHRVDDAVLRRRDGSAFSVTYTANPIVEDDSVTGAVVTFDDTTAARLLQAQLVQAQKLESIGQLAAGIAHELNTPIQYVGDNIMFLREAHEDTRAFLRVALEVLAAARAGAVPDDLVARAEKAAHDADLDYLDEEVPRALSAGIEGVDRVASIVRAMKEFSHPGAHELAPHDLNHVIRNTTVVTRNEYKYVAELELDLDDDLPLVPCLPGEFGQVILNLVINAAHAIDDLGRDGLGHIGISSVRVGDRVRITVSDDGPGIPDTIRSKVFDPFFTTKDVGKGTGQGLALARSIVVDKHGGSIHVESEPGQGTRFVIELGLGSEHDGQDD